jgi:hypothetical protein
MNSISGLTTELSKDKANVLELDSVAVARQQNLGEDC